MKDICSEYIEFKNDCSFLGLGDELWGGARDRWNGADLETQEAVWDRVKEFVHERQLNGELPSMTQINDIIWFDCDDLFDKQTWTVEVWGYQNGSVGEKLPDFTASFEDKDEAVEYAESLDKERRRITLTNDITGDVEEDW